MAGGPNIIDPFHAALHRMAIQHMDGRIGQLAAGSASNMAEYMHDVGYLKGLQAALDMAMEVSHAKYGDAPKESED